MIYKHRGNAYRLSVKGSIQDVPKFFCVPFHTNNRRNYIKLLLIFFLLIIGPKFNTTFTFTLLVILTLFIENKFYHT